MNSHEVIKTSIPTSFELYFCGSPQKSNIFKDLISKVPNICNIGSGPLLLSKCLKLFELEFYGPVNTVKDHVKQI